MGFSDAGFVAENAEAMDTARGMGQWFNTEAELLDSIELLLKGPSSRTAISRHRGTPTPRQPLLADKGKKMAPKMQRWHSSARVSDSA